MDYIQIPFEGGPCLSCYVSPVIHSSKGDITYPAPGSRQALCSLIGSEVLSARFEPNVEMFLEFDRGFRVTIPLRDEKSWESVALRDGALYDEW